MSDTNDEQNPLQYPFTFVYLNTIVLGQFQSK